MSSSLLRAITSIDNIENHTFFPMPLSSRSVVVDLGANQGYFSDKITSRYGVQCFGVEANPALHQKLLPRENDRMRFFGFAVSGSDAPVTLHLSGDITSSSIASSAVPQSQGDVTVPGKTLAAFFREQEIETVDLMKVDIEGAEVAMFAVCPDELLLRIRQITIEFHDDHGFMTNQEFRQIRDRLLSLGFVGIKFSPNNTNWLFCSPDIAGPVRAAYVRYVVRNIRGVFRRLGFRND